RYTRKVSIPGTSIWVNNSLRAIVSQLSILGRYSSVSRRLLFQILDQFVNALFGQVFVERIFRPNLQDRPVAACRHAFHAPPAKQAVGCHFASLHAEPLFDMSHDPLGTYQAARPGTTHLKYVFAFRLQEVHRVECSHLVNLEDRKSTRLNSS